MHTNRYPIFAYMLVHIRIQTRRKIQEKFIHINYFVYLENRKRGFVWPLESFVL